MMPDLLLSRWAPVLLIGGVVLLFNIGLIFAILSGSARVQIQMLRQVARKARNPWDSEDRSLEELHQRVEKLDHAKPGPKDG